MKAWRCTRPGTGPGIARRTRGAVPSRNVPAIFPFGVGLVARGDQQRAEELFGGERLVESARECVGRGGFRFAAPRGRESN